MLRAWNVNVDEAVAREPREAVVNVGHSTECTSGCACTGECDGVTAGERASLVAAI